MSPRAVRPQGLAFNISTFFSCADPQKTILLVTHHLHEIPPRRERVVLLKDGVVVADGAKVNLLTDEFSRLFDQPVTLVPNAGSLAPV